MFRLTAVALLALSLTAGCGEGSFPVAPAPPPPPPLPVSVTVGPDDAAVVSGGRLQYQAVSTSTVTGWLWSLSDAARGSISSDGILTAAGPGPVQVKACAANAPAICGAVAATVVAAPASGGAPVVALSPAVANIALGQTVEFMAGAVNFTTPGWTWLSLDGATASIDANGLLTARRAGFAVVVACASSQPHYCASAQVQVH